MCNHDMRSFLAKLPKCEHHIHLEGALTPELLFKLAALNKIALPEDDAAYASPETLAQRYLEFSSLDDFLHYYYIGMNVLRHESDFEQLARSYFDHAAADGVVHAEVFFDPQAHLSRGISFNAVLNGFTAARRYAELQYGMSTELICCFLKHLPIPETMQMYAHDELQASLKAGTVSGIGLDSSELGFPPTLFQDVYSAAKAAGFKRTAHAGEEGPASNIKDSLDLLHVTRIDHGVRLADDPALMKRVAEQNTLLTVCPQSNVWLRVVKAVSELPIRTFLNNGVSFSINSDDPAYFGNHFILSNYHAVQDAFDLTIDEWMSICRAGVKGSWCSAERKTQLLDGLASYHSEWLSSHS
ncbi:hypothetical protein AMS68_001934 [Peltaster fructicola]|uniref:Adenine deaminase n=1 Tax=Peltaster fructicola TaxID=286661 RepID=A0A6H0XNT1_9PEZI|nr:hypothetical protein AMS68_001934 [Peltaster fructicola]